MESSPLKDLIEGLSLVDTTEQRLLIIRDLSCISSSSKDDIVTLTEMQPRSHCKDFIFFNRLASLSGSNAKVTSVVLSHIVSRSSVAPPMKSLPMIRSLSYTLKT